MAPKPGLLPVIVRFGALVSVAFVVMNGSMAADSSQYRASNDPTSSADRPPVTDQPPAWASGHHNAVSQLLVDPADERAGRASWLSVLLLLAALVVGGAMMTTASVQLDDKLSELTPVQVDDQLIVLSSSVRK